MNPTLEHQQIGPARVEEQFHERRTGPDFFSSVESASSFRSCPPFPPNALGGNFGKSSPLLLTLKMNLHNRLLVCGHFEEGNLGVPRHILVLAGATVQLDLRVVVNNEVLLRTVR